MTTTTTEAPVKRYTHPQGATIDVYANGAVVKRGKDGKVKSTSATAEKLAAGHGGWVEVPLGTEAVAVAPVPAQKAAPAKTLVPMKFKEAPVADLPSYVTDPAWVLQQKVDGVRAQLVFEPGKAPWFRNSTGGRLANSSALGVAAKVAKAFGALAADAKGYSVDGEIVGQAFYAFDLVPDGREHDPLDVRLGNLTTWHQMVVAVGLDTQVRLLPTARGITAKAALVTKVYEQGGEGWIAKRVDGTYTWGARVEHSLKLKITSTVDAVAQAPTGKDAAKASVTLHAYDAAGTLVEIGAASTIGKGTIEPNDVVEVEYLYAGANGRLVQPRIVKKRTDKVTIDCTTDQLRFVNKAVIA